MRDILFRGKRLDNDEWVEGSLSLEYFEKHGCVMISPNEDGCFKVDPETVGQYTGLTDKNGKKIFEGDIVKIECEIMHSEKKITQEWATGTVFYSKSCCYKGKVISSSDEYGLTEFFITNSGTYEVIGNKFEYPELLEVEE